MEKPSAKKAAVKALGGETGVFEGDEYAVVNLYGHILEAGVPEDLAYDKYKETVGGFSNIDGIPWSYEYFDFNKKKPKKSLGATGSNVLKEIKGYLNNGYVPVIASDIDESFEGDLLVHEVLIALNYTGKIYREYHVDELPEKLLKAFREKKEVTREDPGLKKAMTRSNADYLTQQLTRVATVTLQNKGYKLPAPVPFGRLKSAILTLLGSQIDAIAAYKPSSVFESRYKLDNLVLTATGLPQFKTKDEWDAEGLPFEAKVVEKRQVPGTTKPPKALTLSQLTGIMSRKGLGVKKTLDLYQKMYEAQVLSYPRTDDNFITPDQFTEMLPLVDDIITLIGSSPAIFTHREPRSTHVKTGGAHGALRPGLSIPKTLDELDTRFGKGSSAIFKEVASRFLMMFLEDTEWVRHEYETVGTEPVFKGAIKIITKQGVVNPDEDRSDIATSLPDTSKMSQLYPHEVKSTKPSSPTTAWLLKQLEKENVGTAATQPSTVADMTGTSAKSPIKDGKVLSLNPIGVIGYEMAKGTRIGSVDGTRYIQELINEVYKGDKTPEDVYIDFTEALAEDIEHIKTTEVDLSVIPKGAEKKYVEGVWRGNPIRFNGIFLNHEFTEDEQASLLADETIEFETVDNDGKALKLSGKLEEQEFKGKTFIGFKGKRIRDDQVEVTWRGRSVAFKNSFAQHVFTADEIKALANGETISFTGKSKSGKDMSFTGYLEDLEYKGHPYVGVKAEIVREGYIDGVWRGKPVSYKGSFTTHTFTDEENAKLLAGETIEFSGTTKAGKEMTFKGRLEEEEYQGRMLVKFTPIFENKPREGYVQGSFKGKSVSYKGEFMSHVFTDEENEKLQAGEKITITGTSKAGKEMQVTGSLQEQTYQGRKFYGFKAEFDNKADKGL